MLTSIAVGIAQNVVLGWLWRRAQELASFAGIFVPIYLAMPPAMQEDVRAIFTGQGGGLSISALFGIAYYLWTQWQSYRATVKPQVVTTDGQKRELPKAGVGVGTTRQVEALAESTPQPKTLWERITGQ